MTGTTPRQAELLSYLRRHIGEHGVAPTYEQMRRTLGLKSKNSIHVLISGLEQRGKIRRHPKLARAIEIIEPGDLTHIPTKELRRELMRRMSS